MRVHLVKEETVEEYMLHNVQSRTSLEDWLMKIKTANWNTPADIQTLFPSSDLLGNGTNRIVFNICGNRYRMICKYLFGGRQVHLFILWIGTHGEYDKLCRYNEQYTVSNY